MTTVSQEDAREAMQDPLVAKVIDAFKGRIVDIKHPGAPAAGERSP